MRLTTASIICGGGHCAWRPWVTLIAFRPWVTLIAFGPWITLIAFGPWITLIAFRPWGAWRAGWSYSAPMDQILIVVATLPFSNHMNSSA
jgi:hypothetical protein